MPLLDHFHRTPDNPHTWRSFHAAWSVNMVRLLNGGVLPDGYIATPARDRAGPIEVDVATLYRPAGDEPDAPRPWAMEAPTATVTAAWSPNNSFAVNVHTDDGDPELVAVVELVSPANKDRPEKRQAFVAKCAGLLNAGCGLVVVDLVTDRRANLHAELLALLGAEPTDGGGSLSVVAYRALGGETDGRLEVWPSALGIGQPLPTVPLWLHGEFAVPLDLEASHTAACIDLRIRRAG